MDLNFTEAEKQFQLEVRQFLNENMPELIGTVHKNNSGLFLEKKEAMAWQAILAERGWAAPHWPKHRGGTDWTPVQHYLFSKEYYLQGAPMLIPQGLSMVAPIILEFGTEQQKAYFLPKIMSGEHYWCQGYSEPEAGSDLAGVKMKATADGEDYILNGSKMWTTHAHYADYIFCLVRTQNSKKPQQGITFLLIDMALPGITVDPIVTMAGEREVNQVFFENVRVSQRNRIGEENKGWTYAKHLLVLERAGGFNCDRIRYEFLCLLELIEKYQAQRPEFDDSGVISRVSARIEIDLRMLETTELRVLCSSEQGGNTGAQSSVIKIMTSRLEQAINQLALDLIAYDGLSMTVAADGSGYRDDYISSVTPRYLNNRAQSIFGGSDEVQLNVIAKAILGL
ncbi:MAG: acyl-CoA dehydrogenase family protein [Halioglobus sp.]